VSLNLPKDNHKRGIAGDRELPVNYDKISQGERRIVREQYIREQKGICPYCNNPLDDLPSKEILEKSKYINWTLFPNGFLTHPLHLHHDHDTGLTIGAIHNFCNACSFFYDGV
jgi:hypothetical protein